VPVVLSEDRASILSAGHGYLDFYAKIPFYAMFSKAGFQIISDQIVPDTLIENLVISGNEATVAGRFTEVLGTGINELMVSLVPVTAADEDEQRALLMHLISRL
jgi:hypothetical protein